MTDVFISYRRAPSASLAQLIQVLLKTNHGIDAYLDVTRADSAYVQFPDRLMQAIDDAPVFVCLLGDTTLESEWVLKEIQRAHADKKPCIPVFQEGYVAYAGTDPAVLYLLAFDGAHVFDVKNIHTEHSVADIVRLLPKAVTPKPVQSITPPAPKTVTLADAIQALEADEFDRAMDVLGALKQAGNKYADHYLTIARAGQASRQRRVQAQAEYDDLLLQANSKYGLEQARAAWPQFCAEYSDVWRELDKSNRLERRFFVMLSPFAWMKIPTGKVTLKEEHLDQSYIGKKGESRTFHVPTFDIAKYPVTVAQYDLFIQDSGYQNDQWWDGLAQRFDAPETLPDFSQPDHPRVNVSWFESIAYCRWLSDKIELNITLPTEQMWQRAAQGDDGREYPWGAWADGRANVYDGKEAKNTTPVTHYAGRDKGDSPYGVSDMAGNVWEWCLTAYETGDNGLAGGASQVLRGGSWDDPRRSASAVVRSLDIPKFRDFNFGFRVSVVLPTSLSH